MNILFIILPIAAASVCYYYAVVQPVRHEQRKPSAEKPLSHHYQNEFHVLEDFITHAHGLDELQFAEKKVKCFKRKYRNQVYDVRLQYDINELLRHIGLQEVIIREYPTVLN